MGLDGREKVRSTLGFPDPSNRPVLGTSAMEQARNYTDRARNVCKNITDNSIFYFSNG